MIISSKFRNFISIIASVMLCMVAISCIGISEVWTGISPQKQFEFRVLDAHSLQPLSDVKICVSIRAIRPLPTDQQGICVFTVPPLCYGGERQKWLLFGLIKLWEKNVIHYQHVFTFVKQGYYTEEIEFPKDFEGTPEFAAWDRRLHTPHSRDDICKGLKDFEEPLLFRRKIFLRKKNKGKQLMRMTE